MYQVYHNCLDIGDITKNIFVSFLLDTVYNTMEDINTIY